MPRLVSIVQANLVLLALSVLVQRGACAGEDKRRVSLAPAGPSPAQAGRDTLRPAQSSAPGTEAKSPSPSGTSQLNRYRLIQEPEVKSPAPSDSSQLNRYRLTRQLEVKSPAPSDSSQINRYRLTRQLETKSPAPSDTTSRLSTYPRTHLEKGLYFKQKNQKSQALLEFILSAKENPRQVRAFFEQALIFASQGKARLACSALEQALAIAPDYKEARTLLLELHLKSGNLPAVVDQTVKMLAADKSAGKEKLLSAIDAWQDNPAALPAIQMPHGFLPLPAPALGSRDSAPRRPAPNAGSSSPAAGPRAEIRQNQDKPDSQDRDQLATQRSAKRPPAAPETSVPNPVESIIKSLVLPNRSPEAPGPAAGSPSRQGEPAAGTPALERAGRSKGRSAGKGLPRPASTPKMAAAAGGESSQKPSSEAALADLQGGKIKISTPAAGFKWFESTAGLRIADFAPSRPVEESPGKVAGAKGERSGFHIERPGWWPGGRKGGQDSGTGSTDARTGTVPQARNAGKQPVATVAQFQASASSDSPTAGIWQKTLGWLPNFRRTPDNRANPDIPKDSVQVEASPFQTDQRASAGLKADNKSTEVGAVPPAVSLREATAQPPEDDSLWKKALDWFGGWSNESEHPPPQAVALLPEAAPPDPSLPARKPEPDRFWKHLLPEFAIRKKPDAPPGIIAPAVSNPESRITRQPDRTESRASEAERRQIALEVIAPPPDPDSPALSPKSSMHGKLTMPRQARGSGPMKRKAEDDRYDQFPIVISVKPKEFGNAGSEAHTASRGGEQAAPSTEAKAGAGPGKAQVEPSGQTIAISATSRQAPDNLMAKESGAGDAGSAAPPKPVPATRSGVKAILAQIAPVPLELKPSSSGNPRLPRANRLPQPEAPPPPLPIQVTAVTAAPAHVNPRSPERPRSAEPAALLPARPETAAQPALQLPAFFHRAVHTARSAVQPAARAATQTVHSLLLPQPVKIARNQEATIQPVQTRLPERVPAPAAPEPVPAGGPAPRSDGRSQDPHRACEPDSTHEPVSTNKRSPGGARAAGRSGGYQYQALVPEFDRRLTKRPAPSVPSGVQQVIAGIAPSRQDLPVPPSTPLLPQPRGMTLQSAAAPLPVPYIGSDRSPPQAIIALGDIPRPSGQAAQPPAPLPNEPRATPILATPLHREVEMGGTETTPSVVATQAASEPPPTVPQPVEIRRNAPAAPLPVRPVAPARAATTAPQPVSASSLVLELPAGDNLPPTPAPLPVPVGKILNRIAPKPPARLHGEHPPSAGPAAPLAIKLAPGGPPPHPAPAAKSLMESQAQPVLSPSGFGSRGRQEAPSLPAAPSPGQAVVELPRVMHDAAAATSSREAPTFTPPQAVSVLTMPNPVAIPGDRSQSQSELPQPLPVALPAPRAAGAPPPMVAIPDMESVIASASELPPTPGPLPVGVRTAMAKLPSASALSLELPRAPATLAPTGLPATHKGTTHGPGEPVSARAQDVAAHPAIQSAPARTSMGEVLPSPPAQAAADVPALPALVRDIIRSDVPTGSQPAHRPVDNARAAVVPAPLPIARDTFLPPQPLEMEPLSPASQVPTPIPASIQKYLENNVTPVVKAHSTEAQAAPRQPQAKAAPSRPSAPENAGQRSRDLLMTRAARQGAFSYQLPVMESDSHFLSGNPVRSIPGHGKGNKDEGQAEAQDKITERMRYLMEHGTSSLRPGEAFMYSEETGEGVLFLPDGHSEKRKLTAPVPHEQIARQRRPDIIEPKELQYSLSLLGKLLAPDPANRGGQDGQLNEIPRRGPTLEELLDRSSGGFWGRLRGAFKL